MLQFLNNLPKLLLIFSLFFAGQINTSFAQEANWVWINGDSIANQLPIRKTFGTPHPDNNPGTRLFSTNWTDKDGNFWLYGGHVYYGAGDIYGDLWCYYPSLNQWAWIWGEPTFKNLINYGVKGIGSITNSPGARLWAGGCSDNQGNLWLSGGASFDSNNTFPPNDLWRYNIATKIWTWEAGVKTHPLNEPSKATAKNKPDSNFLPRAVWFPNLFCFDNVPKIYFFGGKSQNDSVNNHLFSYNTLTREWTWISGVLQANDSGFHGAKNIFSAENSPSARTHIYGGIYQHKFILFGGGNLWKNNLLMTNDIWVFDTLNKLWVWKKGESYPNSYGENAGLCYVDSSNNPSARSSGSCFNPNNIDSCGNFYIYGGNNDDHNIVHNDVWKYNVQYNSWILVKPGAPGVDRAIYKIKNSLDPNSNPGKLIGYSQWVSKKGELYLYGGISSNPYTMGYSTMWKLIIDSNCTKNCYTNFNNQINPKDTLINQVNIDSCIPNIFSPNGDAKNDYFKPLCPDLDIALFCIYNRWGEKIFETTDKNIGWDGNFNNQPQQSGVYFYLIKYRHKKWGLKILKGDITLIR
jgi:gliding motility-associated-like protein